MSEPTQPASLACLSEQQRKEAMARFAVLQPHIEHDVPLPEAARHAGVALRTVERWLCRYPVFRYSPQFARFFAKFCFASHCSPERGLPKIPEIRL
jgi:hypothetical protein